MKLDPETISVLDHMGKIYEDGLREQLGVPDGWKYISTRTSKKAMDDLMEIVGEAPVQFVVIADSVFKDGTKSVRFSAFFSPEAIQKLQDFMAEQKLVAVPND